MTERSPQAWGVSGRYRATDGRRRRVAPATLAALTAALDAGGTAAAEETAPLVVVLGEWPGLDGPAEVELEGGEIRGFADRLPGDLPLGYHRLHREGRSRPLIVTPPRCHLPAGLHTFGFAVQLYSTRSRESWGIGDLADLAEIGRWARGLGAGALLVNPLHAAMPLPPVEPSPYSPSSRLFLNPIYLRPEGMAGGRSLEDLAGEARALNAERRIDRDRVLALKLSALERRFAEAAPLGAAQAALADRPLLSDFALFCALAEREGPDWRHWPGALAHRDPAALRKAAGELADRVHFHAWVQTLLDGQMAAASAALPLIQDLPVGFQPGGADAWLWQELLAPGVTIGAPPDMFNARGQAWGLPAFAPGSCEPPGTTPSSRPSGPAFVTAATCASTTSWACAGFG